MVGEAATQLLAVLAVLGAGFCLGVSWAAYRAVGWVERIRAWASQACEQEVRP